MCDLPLLLISADYSKAFLVSAFADMLHVRARQVDYCRSCSNLYRPWCKEEMGGDLTARRHHLVFGPCRQQGRCRKSHVR